MVIINRAYHEREVSVVEGSAKIIFTRRAKELAVALAFMCLVLLIKHYPLDPKAGWWLGQGIFMIVFGLTYMREERRAQHPSYSAVVIKWNRIEEIVFTLTVVGVFAVRLIFQLSPDYFNAYLFTYVTALLSGLLAGEVLWQHMRLHQVEEMFRNRYWAGYNDSIFV